MTTPNRWFGGGFALAILFAGAGASSAEDPPIIPDSMCLTLLVRDGLGLPTVRSHHQPAAVKIALPRRLERLANVDLDRVGLPQGVFLDQARMAPYSVASGALMPLRSPREFAHLHAGGAGHDTHEAQFLKELSELLSRIFANQMGSNALLGQGLTISPVVNTFTGNLFVCSLDGVALWKGLNVMLYRVYNGLRRGPGPFGPGWTHNFSSRLDVNEDASVQYTRWDGSSFCYKPNSEGGYVSPPGFRDSLTRSGTGWVLEEETGFFIKFDSTGRMREVGNPLDFRLRLEYRGDMLTAVRNIRIGSTMLPGTGIEIKKGSETPTATNVGPGVFLSYDAQGRVTQIRSTQGTQMDYTYADSGRLKRVLSNTQQEIEYRYDGQGRLAEVRNTKSGTRRMPVNLGVLYDDRDRVSEILDENGNPAMRLSYRWAEDRTTQIDLGQQKVLVTDVYDERGVLVERIEADQSFDPLDPQASGGQRQRIETDGNLNVVILHRKDGTNTRWTYDRSGRLVRAQDSSGEWVEMSYHPSLGLMEYIRESTNNRWLKIEYNTSGEIHEIALDDGNRYKLTYDDGGVPRELINATGESIPLDLGLPPEIPKQLWDF